MEASVRAYRPESLIRAESRSDEAEYTRFRLDKNHRSTMGEGYTTEAEH